MTRRTVYCSRPPAHRTARRANLRYTGVVQDRTGRPDPPNRTCGAGEHEHRRLPGQAATLQAGLDAVADLPVRAVLTAGDDIDPRRTDRAGQRRAAPVPAARRG